jgi:hypothetical protein
LQTNHQLRKKIHPLDKLSNVPGSAFLDIQVVANLPGGGYEILAVIASQLKQIVPGKLAPTLLVISKRIWRKQYSMSITC